MALLLWVRRRGRRRDRRAGLGLAVLRPAVPGLSTLVEAVLPHAAVVVGGRPAGVRLGRVGISEVRVRGVRARPLGTGRRRRVLVPSVTSRAPAAVTVVRRVHP
ncbi:hypothetical protein ACSNOK_00935 [Streptomyces sp. URMC 126]|uniref:hypothetical protein n=1 Tax=Streptomyces sp. URMC 126 TaxID=3423401 RepID=UPI003F1C2A61